MSKKRKVTKGDPSRSNVWTPLQLVKAKPNPVARETDPEGYDALQQDYIDGKAFMYQNSLYTVHLRLLGRDKTQALWLSIRHNDRKAIRDWRHFQRIKNEIVGDEREAVEIYPKESQLVDEANTYHLWVLAEADTLPFGFKGERMVSTPEVAEAIGAKQRPFED
jgi:hypothetical protein